MLLSVSTTFAFGLAPPSDEPGCTSCAIQRFSGRIFVSSLRSISLLAAISSRKSVKGGIRRVLSVFINSPSGVSLKRKPPIREKSSMPTKKSNDESRRTGRFSSCAWICSRRSRSVRPHLSGSASAKQPKISFSGWVY